MRNSMKSVLRELERMSGVNMRFGGTGQLKLPDVVIVDKWRNHLKK